MRSNRDSSRNNSRKNGSGRSRPDKKRFDSNSSSKKNVSRSFSKNSSRFSKKSEFRPSFPQFEQGIHLVNKFPRVYSDKKGKITKFLVESVSGTSYFEEGSFSKDGVKYREVNPERSKLFAGIALGISQIGFKQDSKVLYLGASHGYTVSFLADMIVDGEIYALDFAPRVLRDLVFLCEDKKNLAPVMADANKPSLYKDLVPEVDVIFMDISQRNQSQIFLNNCDVFLKNDGFGLLALKARSVDVTRKPKDVFKQVRSELEAHGDYVIVDYKELSPLEQDHALFVVKKK